MNESVLQGWGQRLLHHPLFWIMAAISLYFLLGDPAHAAGAGAGGATGLPWEDPIDKLRASISGPVAQAIAVLGFVACGVALIFGGEIGEFTRRTIYVVLAVCIVVFANALLTGGLFTGAVVPEAGLGLTGSAALVAVI